MSAPSPPTDSLHTDDVHWMQLALAQARLAAAQGEVPVGAVVVKDGQLLAVGRNAPVADHDPTAHAEVVALRAAAQALGNYRLNGCTLYVTLEPCAMCSGALLHARLDRVVFGAPDPKTGAAGSVVNLFALPALNPHTLTQGGVLATECGQALRDFFAPRRRNPHPLRDYALRTPAPRWQYLPDWPWPAQTTTDLPELDGLQLAWFDTALPLTDSTPDNQSKQDTPLSAFTDERVCVCLHPDGAWSYAHRHLAAALVASGWRVLMPDLIGFGHSDKPKKERWHTPQRHARVLHEWAMRQGIAHAVWVVPHAGGMAEIATELLNQHPHLFSAVVQLTTDRDAAPAPAPASASEPATAPVPVPVPVPVPAKATATSPSKTQKTSKKAQRTSAALLHCPELAPYQAPFPNPGFRAAERAWAAWPAATHRPAGEDDGNGLNHRNGRNSGSGEEGEITRVPRVRTTLMPRHGLDDAAHCAALARTLTALSSVPPAASPRPDEPTATTAPTPAAGQPNPISRLSQAHSAAEPPSMVQSALPTSASPYPQ